MDTLELVPHVKRQKGIALIEIVIGTSIIALVVLAVYGTIIKVRDVELETGNITRANYLLLEAIDVMKIKRDEGWTANIAPLSLDTPHYLAWNSGAWSVSTTENIIDGIFYRSVSLSEVFRDGGDSIASSGISDPGTRKLTATISWRSGTATSTKVFESYLMDIYQN